MKTLLLLGVLLLTVVTSVFAGGQHVIPNYTTAQRNFFWTKLYVNGGRDLYCNVRFIIGQRLTVEHVYAADWVASRFGCENRDGLHLITNGLKAIFTTYGLLGRSTPAVEISRSGRFPVRSERYRRVLLPQLRPMSARSAPMPSSSNGNR